MAKKRLPRKLRPELIVDSRELENVVFECGCGCRIEEGADGAIREGATCPSCGRSLDAERRALELYARAYDALATAPLVTRFRIAPRGKFRVRRLS